MRFTGRNRAPNFTGLPGQRPLLRARNPAIRVRAGLLRGTEPSEFLDWFRSITIMILRSTRGGSCACLYGCRSVALVVVGVCVARDPVGCRGGLQCLPAAYLLQGFEEIVA